jgi:hypothetical protein
MKPYALAVVCVISAAVTAAAQTEIAKASVPASSISATWERRWPARCDGTGRPD